MKAKKGKLNAPFVVTKNQLTLKLQRFDLIMCNSYKLLNITRSHDMSMMYNNTI